MANTGLPRVFVTLSNNNLGRVQGSEDGIAALIVSGVAVGGQFALGDVLGPFTSVQDAIDKGITAAYDATNTCLAHKHISDFYSEAGVGAELYVMVVDKTVTMEDICDKTNAYAKALIANDGRGIKLVGITRVPDGAYAPVYAGQLDPDVVAAVLKAQELRLDEFADPNKRPVHFFIEGRDFQGSVSTLTDLRDPSTGPNANRVSVVLGNDYDIASATAYKEPYASVGLVLGRYAKIAVQRSAGRVRDGQVATIVRGGFSGGYSPTAYTTTQQNTMHDKGYIFFRTFPGKPGYYINHDGVACPLTDDYYTVNLGRVIDKVARLTDQFLADYVNEDLTLDAETGTLPISVCKALEGDLDAYISKQMQGEMSRVKSYVNPNQNLITDPTLKVEVFVLPKASVTYLSALVRYIDLTTEKFPS